MMTLYKDNPNIACRKVKTITGETEYRRNCRKIRDTYYRMNDQCVEIEDKWYATNSKLITFDYEIQKYVLISKSKLIYGVVDFKDNVPVLGYFTENKYNNVLVNTENHSTIRAYNADILIKNDHVEDLSSGIWYPKKSISASTLERFSKLTYRKVFKEKGYNIEDNAEEFREKVELFGKYPLKLSVTAMKYGKFLGKTTYGCEVETGTGYVPDHIQYRYGVVICRDGSIENAEYVTVPMSGAKGIVALKEFSKELCKRTTVNIKCALHFHLGNLPDSRIFLVSLYALALRIQDEIFTMFPYYKTEWKHFKKKDYCQKLHKLGIPILESTDKESYDAYIHDAYTRIFTWLNEGNNPDDEFNRRTHRHLRNHKWERSQRYFWLNFMNMFFSERKTAEFRLHHATTNSQKIINWLFICNAIVQYASKNPKTILATNGPIRLNTIMDYYATSFKTKEAVFLSDYLKAYIQDRKDYFHKDYIQGDYESRAEQKEDKTYVFEYNGVKDLF